MLQSSLLSRVGSVVVATAFFASVPNVYADHHKTKTADSETADASTDRVVVDSTATDGVTTDSTATDGVMTGNSMDDDVTVESDSMSPDSTAATTYGEDGVEAANVDAPADDTVTSDVNSDMEGGVHSSEMDQTAAGDQTAEEEEEEEENSPAVVEGETYDATTSTTGELSTDDEAAGEHSGVHMDSTNDVEADSAGYGLETAPGSQDNMDQGSMDQGMPGSVDEEEDDATLVPGSEVQNNVLGTETGETQMEQETDSSSY